jgi:hypothetical protein
MKNLMTIILVILALCIVQPAAASTDICILASQAVKMEKKEIDVFFKDKVARRLLTGRGVVKSVKQTAGEGVKGNYQVEIFCSPSVIIKFQTNEFWVKRSGAVKDATVSFSGECTQMHKSLDTLSVTMRATIR